MKILSNIIATGAIVFLSGCHTQMKVNVSILDRSYWATAKPMALQNAPDLFASYSEAQKADALDKTLKRLSEFIDSEAKAQNITITSANRDRMLHDVKQQVETDLKDYRASLEKAVRKYWKALERTEASYRSHLSILNDYYEARDKFDETGAQLANLINSSASPTLKQQMTSRAAEAAAGGAGFNEIRSDGAFSLVVGAPASFWHDSVDAIDAETWYGNGDIAIKATDAAATNFTLKGVKLDATKTISATVGVTRAAVQTIATIYGVPAPLAPKADAGAGQQNQEKSEPSPTALTALAKKQIKAMRSDRLATLDALLARQSALLDADDTKRGTAVDTILSDYKAELKTSP